jgi:hypothetical protein
LELSYWHPLEGFRMKAVQPEGPLYEPPRLDVLGAVETLTQLQDKKYGVSDGFTFMGVPVANASA